MKFWSDDSKSWAVPPLEVVCLPRDISQVGTRDTERSTPHRTVLHEEDAFYPRARGTLWRNTAVGRV